MKTCILVCFLILSVTAIGVAGDYVRVGVDSLPAGMVNARIPFYFERTCAEPSGRITNFSNAFSMIPTGDVSWSNSYVDWGLLWIFGGVFSCNLGGPISGAYPDGFVFSLFSLPPGNCGLAITNDALAYTLILDVGPGEGEILIDSSSSYGAWRWAGLTCGLGGAPDRPLFVDKYGSDAVHPIRIVVYRVCGDVDGSGNVDIDDIVSMIGYIFAGSPAPPNIAAGDVDCSGSIDIDDVVYIISFVFSSGPPPCDPDGDGEEDC